MKLYAHRFCPYSRRVRIALAEHDVDSSYLELAPNQPHPAEIADKTPGGRGVPVLMVQDDFVLFDSAAICYWLDSAYPRSLIPSQREPQAMAWSWFGWSSKLYAKLKKMHEGDERAEGEIVDALSKFEPLLRTEWLVGDEFSIADVAFGPIVGALSKEAIERLPEKVRAWAGRVRARPSVREVCELDVDTEAVRPSQAA